MVRDRATVAWWVARGMMPLPVCLLWLGWACVRCSWCMWVGCGQKGLDGERWLPTSMFLGSSVYVLVGGWAGGRGAARFGTMWCVGCHG